MSETIAARDFRLANNSTPPVELGWTLDRDGKVVSNGCECRFFPAFGWVNSECPIHGGRNE